MAVMDSLSVWTEAAGGGGRGIEWRDAVTARMMASSSYAPYEPLVAEAAAAIDLPIGAADRLVKRWAEMVPWPDAAAISGLSIPYAFVTNCSGRLAGAAARRSGLEPRFVSRLRKPVATSPIRLSIGRPAAAWGRTLLRRWSSLDRPTTRPVHGRRASDRPLWFGDRTITPTTPPSSSWRLFMTR